MRNARAGWNLEHPTSAIYGICGVAARERQLWRFRPCAPPERADSDVDDADRNDRVERVDGTDHIEPDHRRTARQYHEPSG